MKTLYLAGPMTGYEYHNFPAFDKATEDLTSRGFKVISPADIDRALGYDGMVTQASPPMELLKIMFMRDLMAVMYEVDEVCLLPGWRKSKGACIESALACMLGKPCWEYEGGFQVSFHASTAASKALQEIAIERERQIREEGFDANHDRINKDGQLARAAACYAITDSVKPDEQPEQFISSLWSWGLNWFKPSTKRRNLTKAGALIVAEMELE